MGLLVQFLGTAGIIAVGIIASVVTVERTRGTVAVIRVDAKAQSQYGNTALASRSLKLAKRLNRHFPVSEGKS